MQKQIRFKNEEENHKQKTRRIKLKIMNINFSHHP